MMYCMSKIEGFMIHEPENQYNKIINDNNKFLWQYNEYVYVIQVEFIFIQKTKVI